jgi:carboxymethylenebutenolidase
MTRQRVDLTTPEGVLDCFIFQPAGAGSWPAVILYMDAFGVRPDLDVMAERLAGEGYVVAVPNLYYRSGPFPPFDPAQVAAGGAERERFMGLIRSIDGEMVMRDTAAVLAHLDADPAVTKGSIGTVGYCMGGGYALRAAGVFPDRVAAAASFHGGSLATDRPDSPHRLADRMRARLYVGVAAIDPGFTDEQRQRLDAALRAAGVAYEIETYDGAQHGFAVHNHRVYDRAASERHWQRLLGLLGGALRAGVARTATHE